MTSRNYPLIIQRGLKLLVRPSFFSASCFRVWEGVVVPQGVIYGCVVSLLWAVVLRQLWSDLSSRLCAEVDPDEPTVAQPPARICVSKSQL